MERPASVVKELIENSIDAGATGIFVELEQGGMRLILVRDNGSGMEADDARMSFARHATSKISSLDDLSNIQSFGFRGEALAAISSVAFVTLKTRPASQENGAEISYAGGAFKTQKNIGCPPGTEIAVRSLFYNTPARKKFLKTEQTEAAHAISVVTHMALAYPKIGFSLWNNGKEIFSVPHNSLLETRLAALLGSSLIRDFIPVHFTTPSIKITGFVGTPGAHISSRRHQYLFVNGRDVSDPLVSRAVLDAYGSRLPGRSFPVFLLHIEVSPADVDVNVHPRKLSVKFLEPSRIYRDTSQAVSQALDEFQKKLYATPQAAADSSDFFPQAMTAKFQPEQNALFEREHSALRSASSSTFSAHLLGQVADSYLVIFEEEGLALVDQHAAHERIMYEKFKAQELSKQPESQQLLTPTVCDFLPEEKTFFAQALPHLQKLGFEVDEWSGGTLAIHACPSSLARENLQKILKEIVHDLMGESAKKDPLPERILKSLACKAAVKFGMPLSRPEQENLLQEINQTPNSATCPHGRPTKLVITFEELERRFYRKK